MLLMLMQPELRMERTSQDVDDPFERPDPGRVNLKKETGTNYCTPEHYP